MSQDPSKPSKQSTSSSHRKKDGSHRIWLDYHELNAVTVRDLYSLICKDKCIESLGEARNLQIVEANYGYWQVVIDERDRKKTELNSHHGLFQSVRMPLGLKNEPVTFQRAIENTLSSVK